MSNTSLVSLNTSVGKTGLMDRYVGQKFTGMYQPTVSVEFRTKNLIVDDKLVRLEVRTCTFTTPFLVSRRSVVLDSVNI